MNALKQLLCEKLIDICAVSETWLKNIDSNKFSKILGYTCVRNDRLNKRGGGVCLYIKNGIKYKVLDRSPGPFDNKPEFLITEINTGRAKILIAVVYRRPKGEGIKTFCDSLNVFTSRYDDCIVCGDFNIDCNKSNVMTQKFIMRFNDLCLAPIPFVNTHVTVTSQTTIDYVFIPDQITNVSFGQIAFPDLSLHDLLYLCYPIPVPSAKPRIIKYRDFNKINVDEFMNDALSIEWHNITTTDDINNKVSMFNDMLLTLIDNHAPLLTLKVKKGSLPWINKAIRALMKLRNKAKLKFKHSHNPMHFNHYKSLNKKVKKSIKSSFRDFMSAKITNNLKSSVLWKNLKQYGLVTSNNDTEPINVPLDDLIDAFTLQEFPDTTLLENDYVNLSQDVAQDEKFFFRYITPLEIKTCIISIVSSAYGADNISIQMCKLVIDIVLPSITHIYNYSLQNSVFPDLWKQALLKPIAKKANPSQPLDFRPISILCVLAKALEKFVCEQTTEFISSSNILPTYQSGFRKGHSTGTALLRVCEDARAAMARDEVTVLVLLDYSKAFDRVVHSLLLAKLRFLKFSDSVIKWFQSYLSDRLQCVMNGDVRSKWRKLLVGLPQGSSLSPLLYSIYTFDIHTVLKYCKYHLYADDLQIYRHCKLSEINETVHLINADLQEVSAMSIKNGLSLNIAKTQAIIISKSRIPLNQVVDKIQIDGQFIEYSDKVKNLGVVMDCSLSWKYYVSQICQKVQYSLHHLYKFRFNTPQNTRVRLVQSLILPLFDYCDFLLTSADAECIFRLQVAQNNAIRYCLNINRRAHITPHYRNLTILKIKERIELHALTLTHKILHNYTPPYLKPLFTLMRDIRQRPSRAHDLSLQVPGKEFQGKSFPVLCAKLWNSLPASLCLTKSTDSFKAGINNMLLKRYD